MEITIITAIVGSICAVGGFFIGYLGLKRNQTNDVKIETEEDTREKVQLNTKLDVLLSNNAELKGSVKELSNKLDNFKTDVTERLARVEEHSSQVDKRLDFLEQMNAKKERK